MEYERRKKTNYDISDINKNNQKPYKARMETKQIGLV